MFHKRSDQGVFSVETADRRELVRVPWRRGTTRWSGVGVRRELVARRGDVRTVRGRSVVGERVVAGVLRRLPVAGAERGGRCGDLSGCAGGRPGTPRAERRGAPERLVGC